MKQTSRLYLGVLTMLVGLVLLASLWPSVAMVVALILILMGLVQAISSRVSTVSIGDRTLSVHHLLAIESALGGLGMAGAGIALALETLATGSTIAGIGQIALALAFAVWLFYNASQFLAGNQPLGYPPIERNVSRDVRLG